MAQAKPKSNSVVTTQWSGSVLTINVLGAQLVDGQPADAALMFDMTLASEANREAAERHGWTQRLCDRAAKGRDPKTGASASAASKYAAIDQIIKYYESGDVAWKMSGGGAAEGGLLYDALVELRTDKTAEQIRTFLDGRTPAQLATLRKVKELVEIMNRLRVERAGEVDAGDALGELDDME